jgi:hypothetical protein
MDGYNDRFHGITNDKRHGMMVHLVFQRLLYLNLAEAKCRAVGYVDGDVTFELDEINFQIVKVGAAFADGVGLGLRYLLALCDLLRGGR